MEGETWPRIDLINLQSTSRKGEGSRHAFLSCFNTGRLGDIVVNFSWDGAWHVDENISRIEGACIWVQFEADPRSGKLKLWWSSYWWFEISSDTGPLSLNLDRLDWIKGVSWSLMTVCAPLSAFPVEVRFCEIRRKYCVKEIQHHALGLKTSFTQRWKAPMPACEHVGMMMFTASHSCVVFVKNLWD